MADFQGKLTVILVVLQPKIMIFLVKFQGKRKESEQIDE